MPPSFVGPYEVGQVSERLRALNVWSAQDTRRGRSARVLIADTDVVDPSSGDQFLERARTFGGLDVHSLIGVQETGVTPEGAPYAVTDAADRGSVDRRIGMGTGVTDLDLRRVVTGAGTGLSAVHARNLVYQTVGPESLLLVAGPVSDGEHTGILFDDEVIRLDVPGPVPGDFTGDRLAAPEQLAGEAATKRTDVYRVSGTVAELAAGRRLKPGEEWSSLLAEVARDRPRAAGALSRGLAERAADRPASIAAWADDLLGTLDHVAPAASSSAGAGRGAKLLWVGAAALVVAAAAGGAWALAQGGDDPSDVATDAVVVEATEEPVATQVEPTEAPAQAEPTEAPTQVEPTAAPDPTPAPTDAPEPTPAQTDAPEPTPTATEAAAVGDAEDADGDANGDAEPDEDSEPAEDDSEPAEDDSEPPADDDSEPPADDEGDSETADDDDEPADDDSESAEDDSEPAEDDSEPADDEGEPAEDDSEPAEDDSEPVAGSGDSTGSPSSGGNVTAPSGTASTSTRPPLPAVAAPQVIASQELRDLVHISAPQIEPIVPGISVWDGQSYCPPAASNPARGLRVDRVTDAVVALTYSDLDEFLNIFVNGRFHDTLIPGSNRYLVEGLDLVTDYSITVAREGERSSGSMICARTLGFRPDTPVDGVRAPSDVQIVDVTPSSITLRWIAETADATHSLHLNGRKVTEVSAGWTEHTFTDLAPGTSHRVGVRAVGGNNRSDMVAFDVNTPTG